MCVDVHVCDICMPAFVRACVYICVRVCARGREREKSRTILISGEQCSQKTVCARRVTRGGCFLHTPIYTKKNLYIYLYKCTCIYIYTYIHIYVYVHIYKSCRFVYTASRFVYTAIFVVCVSCVVCVYTSVCVCLCVVYRFMHVSMYRCIDVHE